jgi:S-adenosylmethionine:tRNA ribosyltransferase-isomerase
MPEQHRPENIEIDAYDYPLPEERIARFPLPERDASKLLLYRQGAIRETVFRNIADELPPDAVLLFNDSRVIHARLRFHTPEGRPVEIFCLEPAAPAEYQLNFSSKGPVRWLCLIGNNRHWKQGALALHVDTPQGAVTLSAERIQRLPDAFEVQFSWSGEPLSFGELLAHGGLLPLPPYLERDAVAEDEDRYQTIYARQEGSVAAPTAGLHFTERVFETLEQKGIERLFVTLHVGAGTFKPVKSAAIGDHIMHEESIAVSSEVLARLIAAIEAGRPVIPVGTTAMRTLESLYWYGAVAPAEAPPRLDVAQWTPYDAAAGPLPTAAEALRRITDQLAACGQSFIAGHTRLLIAPGYTFRIAGGLITNFHQPRSTLLLLIAAWTGQDWRRLYDYALAHDFRFLSYGDGMLLAGNDESELEVLQ